MDSDQLRICLATNNAHKISEVHGILGGRVSLLSLKDIGCDEELPEEQDTIAGNSLQKAEYVFSHYKIAAVADDSGLEVEALNGAPGVDSAHYAGPQRSFSDNIDLLLKNLALETNRRAVFRTIITLILPNGTAHQFTGTLPGVILTVRRGTGGFGYDPVFLPDGHTRTLAEMSADEKNKISHRSIAVQQLAAFLLDEISR